MDIGNLLQRVWSWIYPRLESQGINPNEIMDEAMKAGQSNQSTSAVMGMLESKAKAWGKFDLLENNKIWNSFKDKAPQDIISHGMAMLKELGIFNRILGFFTATTE